MTVSAAATLYLVYEPERACLDRLRRDGMPAARAAEVTSYLAQSTDMVPEFDAIARACAARGIAFRPVELDDAAGVLGAADPRRRLVWTLTDGIAYFRGGVAPALARGLGLSTIGADDSLFALCQDKFRSGAVVAAFGLPVPASGLARGSTILVEPPASEHGWFVKPNRLGAKIGIWADSHCATRAAVLAVAARIHDAYGDDALVQAYVPGRNVRASFLAVDPDADMRALGVSLVESGGDFQTMADSLALYGETGEAARQAGAYAEPELVALRDEDPEADARIRAITARLVTAMRLRDVFSLDFRVGPEGRVDLIEFEVCPGLPCFDFRAYLRGQWGCDLAEAMARTAAARMPA